MSQRHLKWALGRRWDWGMVNPGQLYDRFPRHSWPAGAFVVCYNPSEKERYYDVFTSYLEFCEFFETLAPEDRVFTEIIQGDRRQRPHFDIDSDIYRPVPKVSESKTYQVLETEAACHACNLADAQAALRMVVANLQKHIPGLDLARDLIICSSPDPVKVSYHIIVDHWCCANNDEAGELYRRCVADLPEPLRILVDHSVYKPNQQFRLLGSQKPGKGNFKSYDETLYGPHEDEVPLEGADPAFAFRVRFSQALIGFCEGCRPIPGLSDAVVRAKEAKAKKAAARREARGGVDFTLSHEQIAEVRDLLTAWMGLPFELVYDIRDANEGKISLTRLAPSACAVCTQQRGRKVSHEHENPFVCIDELGNVRFYCARAKDADGRFMSSLVGRLARPGPPPPPTVVVAEPLPPPPVVTPSVPATRPKVFKPDFMKGGQTKSIVRVPLSMR